MAKIVARLNGISKYYPGVRALYKTSFELCRGEVHILLGENGAGKSTLIGVLGGIVQPDEGEITIKDQKFSTLTPKLSQGLGVAVIHQELSLIPQLSVAENIFLGRLPVNNQIQRKVNWKQLNEEAKYWLKRFGLDLNPSQPVRTFSVAIQQAIEITKALALNADIIVMDEPTSSLTSREVASLFQMIKDLKNRGCSIIYISHRMDEVKRVGDRVTVLKDGEVVGTRDVATSTIDEMIQMMVGREITRLHKTVTDNIGSEILKVQNFNSPKIKNVNFSVRAGEVLGISGIVGAGRTELMKAIYGADPQSNGEIFLEGKAVRIKSPQDAIHHGICLIPEDRRIEGLISIAPVRVNLSISFWQKIRALLINRKLENEIAIKCRDTLDIKTPDFEVRVAALSGGNQQKVVIGKWININAKVIIFDEPTRGVDVGSKLEIQKIMRSMAEEGKAVVIISSELPELLAVSDRILVMFDGRIVDEFSGDIATEEEIVYCATTGLRRR